MEKKRIKHRFIIISCLFFALAYNLSTYIFTFSEYVSKLSATASGINGAVITVNDTQKDYNYYKGLNYNYSSDGTLPSIEDKNLYNDSNLIEAKVTYFGNDIAKENYGYVSLEEQQNAFIYYKVFPVNNNGTTSLDDDYFEIELISNPYTDRPTDKGFNGWITDYKGAMLSFDNIYYRRIAKVPVTYTNSIPNPIEINFYANWKDAKIGYVNTSSDWNNAFSPLDSEEMKQIGGTIIEYESVVGLYLKGSVSFLTEYPTGAVNDNGQALTGRCSSLFSSCTYYQPVVEGSKYNSSLTYYKLNNSSMSEYQVQIIGFEELPSLEVGTSLAGYYLKKEILNDETIEGLYDKSGSILTGNCTNSDGCEAYEMIQYYDSNGNINAAVEDGIYYYLATRETNIIVMNESVSTKWESNNSKPFTLTSVHNKTNYINSATWDVSSQAVICYNDTAIENIRINSGASNSSSTPSSSSSASGYIYANYQNLKIGRGITKVNTNKTFNGVYGGNNATAAIGSSSDVVKYSLIVESGYYNTITLTNGPSNTNRTKYIEGKGIYGNDYDRITENNELLDVYYLASGSWGAGNYYASTNIGITFDTTIKSGKYGTGKSDHTTGVYVGGRSYGTHYTSRKINVEGGWIYNLIGGPLTASDRANINDTYIYMTGGEVDMIIGGAGTSTTYGNRIVSVTGGKVNYSVFGGSNSYSGSSSEGKLTGSSYVYIGGNCQIGNTDYISNSSTLWGAESGSVFGIGNGNTTSSSIGSSENSNIIIAESAKILGNVYGGGNYSATGISSTSSTTKTNIKVVGGVVNGSIYGGGNKNGSGSENITSAINIQLFGGNIKGNIYGGSKEQGTIYGNTTIAVNNGQLEGNIYGGGQGSSTKVANNVDITYGILNSTTGPSSLGNIYGGSELGTVNGTDTSPTEYKTTVNVNSGTISGEVYGGAKGDDSNTPYVLGDVIVNINGGTINSVFGGNDYSGTPSKTVNMYLNGGTIENAYGGGNKTELDISNIYLKGSTVTNLFGGSNETGDVETSNITVDSGKATTIYGGNNVGGVTTESKLTLNGGEITTLYGGGKLTSTPTTNIVVNNSTVGTIYGGGEKSATVTSNIIVNNGNISELFGGSNIEGDVETSNITTYGGSITTIYGGNNVGGKVNKTLLNINGANIDTIYGGGNNAATSTSLIMINDGIIQNLYGGGNDVNGEVEETTLELNSGAIGNVYGGGNKSYTNIANINSKGSVIINLYGGGNNAGIKTTNINLNNGHIENVYGGSNTSGEVTNSKIKTETLDVTSPISVAFDYTVNDVDSSWQDTNYSSVATIKMTINNNTDTKLEQYQGYIKIKDSTLYSNYSATDLIEADSVYSFNHINKYSAQTPNVIEPNSSYSFEFTVYSKKIKSEFEIIDYIISGYNSNSEKVSSKIIDLRVDNLYGGNNAGGLTTTSNINLLKGKYGNIYGGGNKATLNTPNVDLQDITVTGNIYGGGNEAVINEDSKLNIKNCTVNGSVFGGGNAGVVAKNTNLYITQSTIGQSVYAGGNGTTAIVVGNTKVLIEDNTIVGKHVFGGGNAANIGSENINDSKTETYIAGATISGNVYGGGNTAVVYGNSIVNIGISTFGDVEAVPSDINIVGSVFGGGEANEAGSEIYDFSHISVTKGTEVKIDGNNYELFKITGSIFGSGNASSTSGESYINISNYGTIESPQNNISIQRADLVTLDNSVIELIGATDRTNEYSTVLFSLSRIKHLKSKNNTILYLNNGANLLEEYTSATDVNGEEVEATVSIEDGIVSSNTNNRIYIKSGKNLNIATNENATAYGKVNGMTFFGMYTKDRDDKVITGYYDNYSHGETISSSDLYLFDSGSYVLGFHKANHNIKEDGFYSHFSEEGVLKTDYIIPTPDDSTYYMWSIGEQVITMDLSLTASKYITLGSEELAMLNYSDPNTSFSIVGFNYNELNPEVSLVMEEEVPRIAETSEKADNIMSLVMKSTNSGWITKGTTTFLTADDTIDGTTYYQSENTTDVPSFQFYLYHSKNISTSGSMGNVTISLKVITPIDDLTNKVERINLVVNLNRALYNTNDYEAAMTNGKEYSMFASTNVNLASNGSLSAYYSLYSESDETIYKDGYHRALVSTYAFPVNTKLTMINLKEESVNEYYYYVVTEEDYKNSLEEYNLYGESSYLFSDFIRMGSISENNNYSDEENNSKYYNLETGIAFEEFIIIVDFVDSNITENIIDKSLLLELRNKDDKSVISVLGIQQEDMIYSLYTNSNAVIDVEGSISSSQIYPGNSVKLNITTNFKQKMVDSEMIYDTNYFEQKLGVKISYLDSDNNQVTGASLLGVTYEYNGITYYPRMDGSVRINLAEKMANVTSNIIINTTDSVASGNYTMVIESFGSSDGIYYGEVSSDTETLSINVLDTVYGLSMNMGDYTIILDRETGHNLNDNSDLMFNLKYKSGLDNPNLRISLYRRNYDNVYSLDYDIVDLKEYISNNLNITNKQYEYLLTDSPLSDTNYNLTLKEGLKTGTYKLVISLYDNNTYIGEVYKYLIIKERYNGE